jgi:hypothetical protein
MHTGGNLCLRDGFEDLSIDKDYFKMLLQEAGLERVDYSSGSRQSQVPGSCDNGNENSGSIKCGYFSQPFSRGLWCTEFAVCLVYLYLWQPSNLIRFDLAYFTRLTLQ